MFHIFTGKIIELEDKNIYLKNDLFGIQVTYRWTRQEGEFFLYPHFDQTNNTITYAAFESIDQKQIFLKILKISGIGMKTASLIAYEDVEDIRQAIDENNLNFFKQIPGIGPKTAKRLIIELKSTISKSDIESLQNDNKTVKKIVKSLGNLGFNKWDITDALKTYKWSIDESNLEVIIKYVLGKIK